VAILGLLSDKRDSPLLLLFRAIAQETDLARHEKEQEEQAGRIKDAVDYVQRRMGRVGRLWDRAESVVPRSERPPEHSVSDAFSEIHVLVDTEGNKVSELESILDQLHPLYVYTNNYADRVGKGPKLLEAFKQQESKEADAVERTAQTLPGPLGNWLSTLARDSRNMVSGGVQVEFNKLWKIEVPPFCRRATRNRYPFHPASTAETPLKDFGQLFGPNGVLDRFFKENFSGAVDTSIDPWRWTGDDQGRISAAALGQFQLAAAVHEAFFPAGGSELTVEFKLEAVSLDDPGPNSSSSIRKDRWSPSGTKRGAPGSSNGRCPRVRGRCAYPSWTSSTRSTVSPSRVPGPGFGSSTAPPCTGSMTNAIGSPSKPIACA